MNVDATRPRSLAQWLAFIETLHPKSIAMGLARVAAVARRMSSAIDCPVITVGGTNGKGSTCAMLESMLRHAGYRTGLYMSPHLARYNERVRIAGEEVADAALVVMQGSVKSVPLVLAAFEFNFMGGSMGSVVGERFVRGVRVAFENRLPFVCVAASGGARMQEGVNSLFQMAKTTAVLQELARAKLPFVSVLTDPTRGGVSASFAFVADLVLAEPGALIGFAGPRVIEQTVREKLPEGFQRAEFLLDKGALDMIVDRRQLRDELARLLAMLTRQPAL